MLTIRLIKRPGKPPLLHCVRADGTETIAENVVGVDHDLAHYAVETTLGFRNAFYSLLAGGMDVADFDVAGAAGRLDLAPEAVVTEFIVGLLQVERANGVPYDDFNAELGRAVGDTRRPLGAEELATLSIWEGGRFTISDERLAAIRAMLDELMARWGATPEGGAVELAFP